MQVINYEKLLAEFKPNGYVCEDANTIANKLICKLHIQAGDGLSRFLNVDTCFGNHMAMRVWVQKRLDTYDSYIADEICSQLENELYGLLPQLYSY